MVWFALVACCGAQAETLTIATYNVENYTAADRMTEAGYRKDYPKPEEEKQALRTVIKALNADVLVLQEMGAAGYLDELQRDLKTEGLDYSYAVLLEGPDPDRHVALLARRSPKTTRQYPSLEFNYFNAREKVKRGLLEVTFATAAGDVTLFAVHLKSRLTDRPDDPQSAIRRTAEATAVRDTVLQRFPDPSSARFLILGDCNDTKDSKTLQRLLKRGQTDIALLLPAADTRGETWTHAYRKEESYSRIDHILVSPGFGAAVVGGTAHIYDGPAVREASDHRPVMVTVKL